MVQTWVLNFNAITSLLGGRRGKGREDEQKGCHHQYMRCLRVQKESAQEGAGAKASLCVALLGSVAAWVVREPSISLSGPRASTITPRVPNREVPRIEDAIEQSVLLLCTKIPPRLCCTPRLLPAWPHQDPRLCLQLRWPPACCMESSPSTTASPATGVCFKPRFLGI